MADHFPENFTESDSSDDEFQESSSRKTLPSKVRKASFNPEDEGLFGPPLGEKSPRKALEWETVETYNLKDIDLKDDGRSKRL